MAEAQAVPERKPRSQGIPLPVEDGTEHIESLGPFIDDLFGDSRLRHSIDRELAPQFLRKDEMPDDPPPLDPPLPVPDGDDEIPVGEGEPEEDRG